MAKSLLKVAAGINLAIGGVLLLLSLLFFSTSFLAFLGIAAGVVAIIRLAIGGTFLNAAKKEDAEFENSRVPVLIASIVSILTGHVITFVLSIIAFSYMPKPEPIKHELTEEEKSQRRLRNLLGLGCGLVLLAGIIFAVTTWETLSGAGKIIALAIATLIFFLMSNLSEKKFKLKSSAITYYILANAFFIFTFIAAGYFKVFGEMFSLVGSGKDLYQAFLWILTGILAYFAYAKYDNKNLFYIVYFSVLVVTTLLLSFAKFEGDVILAIIIAVVGMFAIISPKRESIKKANNLANILLPVLSMVLFLFISGLGKGDRIIFNVISFGIAFVSVYYLAIVKKNIFFEIFAPIFSILTAFVLSAVGSIDDRVMFLQLMLITVVVYLIGYYKREQKWLFNTTSVSADIALLYVLFDSVYLDYNYYAIAAGLLLLGTSLMVSLSSRFGKYHFEALLEPVKVILLSYAAYSLTYRFDYTEESLFLALLGFVFSIVAIFKKDIIKKLYFIGGVLLVTWAMLTNISEFAPIVQGLNIVSLVISLCITLRSEDRRFSKSSDLIYGLALISVALFVINIFEYSGLKLIGILVLALIYTVLFVISNKNEVFRAFAIVSLLIPYTFILPYSIWNENINYILHSLPWLALIFTYTRSFLRTAELKVVNIIEIITLAIWYLSVSSEVNIEVAIFVGLISFASILIGFRSEKWFSLYYTGIAFLIVNMIIQLKEFWTSIPIWAYILVAGLVLIGVVTYKEYSKANPDEEEVEKVEAQIVGQPESNAVKNELDIRTIITGSVLYFILLQIIL